MNIGIITGGITGEREVSLASAKNIQKLLEIGDENVFDFPDDRDKILNNNDSIDIFIPVIHGKGGEDGEIQIILDRINKPYIFSTPEVHKVALDKRLAKKIAIDNKISVPREINPDEFRDGKVFAKPVNGGSSVNTILTDSRSELDTFLKSNSETEFIIEEAIEGREFSVGVVEKDNINISLPVVEIKPKSSFFDYESKYDEEKVAEEICPADIDEELTENLKSTALKIHESIGCSHISRSDFIVDNNNTIYFLEINTIPGITYTSIIPKAIKVEGLDFRELMTSWIKASMKD